MKFLFTCLFVSALITSAFSQDETPYRKGLIVTSTDDTIYRLVPLVSAFGIAVLTKTEEGKTDTIPISKIKYLANGMNVYETISFNTTKGIQQKLMWLHEEGAINLYEEYYFDDADKRTEVMMGGTATFNGKAVRTCVLRKDGKTYLLSDKYFIDIVKPLIADSPELSAKVQSKFYNYDNVTDLIKAYNAIE